YPVQSEAESLREPHQLAESDVAGSREDPFEELPFSHASRSSRTSSRRGIATARRVQGTAPRPAAPADGRRDRPLDSSRPGRLHSSPLAHVRATTLPIIISRPATRAVDGGVRGAEALDDAEAPDAARGSPTGRLFFRGTHPKRDSMIIVTKPGISDAQLDHIRERV